MHKFKVCDKNLRYVFNCQKLIISMWKCSNDVTGDKVSEDSNKLSSFVSSEALSRVVFTGGFC